ncbi:MAG: L,D-transpeptidase family protein [Anaerolineales bacterium]|nr:L,D-transpeptidase family protein [Anaerolineales bacterium]
MTANSPLSRRDFLKLGGASLAAALIPNHLRALAASNPVLARVTSGTLSVYRQPDFSSRRVQFLWRDMVVPITRSLQGEENTRFTADWCQVGQIGFAHASGLQPVEIIFQQPIEDLRFTGSLAEVTVPFVDVYASFSTKFYRLYRYYYGSTHWIDKLVHDRDGRAWYRILDDKFPELERWAPADRFRVFSDQELAPISPEVPVKEKRIEVYLEEQRLAAFESNRRVFEARISTGDSLANPKYQTPTGTYLIGLKRPSQHMMPWDRTFGSYDLPGVPWVCYFTNYAHAFHGAFWHNAFGRARSHGCVNLAPEDAKWIYLWSTPVMRPYNQLQYSELGGTRVIVI